MKTKVKICGITQPEDALKAAELGADYLGYIFYAPSKRFVAPRNALAIIKEIRKQYPNVAQVGVFVDDSVDNIAWVRNLAGLDYVQLHGKEDPAMCKELHQLGIDVIKALGMQENGTAQDFREFDVSYFLCDTFDAKHKGGTGRMFDHDLIPDGIDRNRLFLAGGLNPANVEEIIENTHPFAIDVSSGVETAPGIKSESLLKDLFSAVSRINNKQNKE